MLCNAITKIDSTQFIRKVLIGKADALVSVSATWNGSSTLQTKFLNDLAIQFQEQIQFYQIDPEEEASLASTYRVDAVPTLLFFKEGTLVDKLPGLVRRTAILAKLSQLISRNQ